MILRLSAIVLLFVIVVAPSAYAQARAPTPAECAALMDARDQLAPGVSLSAFEPMGGGGAEHRQTRLRAIAAFVPSEALPLLGRAMARASNVEFDMRCAGDRQSGGVRRWRAIHMSLPAFSADGRWMSLSWLGVLPPVGSEGYECAFERVGERWVGRGCELTFIS
jgi:hypothetical protein